MSEFKREAYCNTCFRNKTCNRCGDSAMRKLIEEFFKYIEDAYYKRLKEIKDDSIGEYELDEDAENETYYFYNFIIENLKTRLEG